jgi:hypothetical protein
MHSTLKRVAVLAALGAVGLAAPVSGASAAVTPITPAGLGLPAGLPATGFGLPGAGLPGAGLPGAGLPAAGFGLPTAGLGLGTGDLPAFTPPSFVGPSVGQVAAVIGPTIITTAPSTFINTNNQVSAGGAALGAQAAP